MARIEKTVFISYRRKDISWALAVYQYLTGQKYDVFFDYTSLSGGDFEQVIVSNIRARAHFILILTPTALDRCNEPGDWLRREIETAIDEKRNIIPLFFDGFTFSSPAVLEKLTGKLSSVNRYNGLEVPAGYFLEAMERLRTRYLNVPLDAVIHPVSTRVKKVVMDEKVAADKALRQQKEDIRELVKPIGEKLGDSKLDQSKNDQDNLSIIQGKKHVKEIKDPGVSKRINYLPYGIGIGAIAILACGIFGVNYLIQSISSGVNPTSESEKPPTTTATLQSAAPTTIITPTVTSQPDLIRTRTGDDGMTLHYVPAGEFEMGSDNGKIDEKPIHTVYVDAFWIDQTEVTNSMFAKFLNEKGNQIEFGASWLSPKSKDTHIHMNDDTWQVDSGYEDHPVIEVSWYGANAYCDWAGRRLPTEAEWEKAARGEEGFAYPWGNEKPDNALLNYNKSKGDTTEVGTYPKGASPYGVLDMAGNVWEWVADWYDSSYYKDSPSLNPQGPEDGRNRVLRGGSWDDLESVVRATSRDNVTPVFTDNYTGFRCAVPE